MDLILDKLKPLARYSPPMAYFVMGLFVLLTLVTVIKTLPSFTAPPAPTPHRSTSPIPTAKSPDLALLHLFGASENLGLLPQTLLQLTLEGIAFSEDLTIPSRALISSQNGQTSVYRAGDTIPGGAIIKNIQRDLVILEENNQLERLKLPVPTLRRKNP